MRTVTAFFLLIPLSLFAANTTVTLSTSDRRTTEIDVPSLDTVDLIVEFRDAPLFTRARALSASGTAAAMRAFDARFAQFATDLAQFSPRITNTYERVFSGVSVTVPRAAVAQIQRLSYVQHVYYDHVVRALDDDSDAKINAPQVWTTYATKGRGIVVAIIDTGIDYTHPALGGAYGTHARVIGGFDFVNKDTDPIDDNGHGTHVAGIIGANSDTLHGVAPEVSFLAYKVLSADGSGVSSNVIAAIERASDPDRNGNPSDHADIVNMSLGNSGSEDDDPAVKAVENAAGTGIVFCIAAGNSGAFFAVSSPGIAPSAITVGASDMSDKIASFSSSGPAGNALALKPEVVAPGVNIISAAPGGGTVAKSGTSMATPHVAGVAALVKSLHRDWSPAEVKSAIVSSATDIGADTMAQGAGRVDALRACSVSVVASPAVISFGRDDATRDRWTATGTVDLTNDSNTTVNLTASATGATTGINVAVDPPNLTIGAGETQTATVIVDVDNTLLPYPATASLTLGGRVEFDGGAAPIHVPWAFVKAARVHATYDLDDNGILIVTGTSGSKTFVQKPLSFGARATDAYVAPGVYDMQLNTFAVDTGGLLFRYVFGDRQDVRGDVTHAFLSTAAAPPASIASKDDQGRELANIGTRPGICYNLATLVFPPGSPVTWSGNGIASQTGQHLRLSSSSLPDGFSLTADEACWDGKSSMYIAQLGSITSADAQSGEIAADPSSWQHVPLRVVMPQGIANPSLVFGFSTVTHTPTGLSSIPRYFPMKVDGNAWSGMLYITREQHPVVTTAGVLRLTGDVGTAKGIPFIDARLLRATQSGILLNPYATDAPTAYVATSGESLTFGGGPVHPEMFALIDNGTFGSGGTWVGPLDETRLADAATTTVVVRDASGTTLPPPVQITQPGIYSATITNGEATLVAHVDSRLADTATPSLRSLRIIDANGRETPVVARGSHATLRFAALDYINHPDTRTFTYDLVDVATATASWRPHGGPVWQPLALRVAATDIAFDNDSLLALGHAPAGVVFASDLTAAAQVNGSMDLRLHVQDASGNAIDYELDDAFAVSEGRPRVVTH